MVEEKGLEPSVADKIREYVKLIGGKDLLMKLNADKALTAKSDAQKGLKDMELLLHYCGIFEILDKVTAISLLQFILQSSLLFNAYQVSFDLSLARGLDYYTGVIFEAVLTSK